MEFFFFSVFVFVVSGCGLLRRFTPRNDKEGGGCGLLRSVRNDEGVKGD